MYFTINVQSKVCALLIAGCQSILADLSRACFLVSRGDSWLIISIIEMKVGLKILNGHSIMKMLAGPSVHASKLM